MHGFSLTTLLGLFPATLAVTMPIAKALALKGSGLDTRNPAAIIGNIDPRFSLTFQYDEPLISSISCLMNAVHAMQELALGNFFNPVGAETYSLPNYPSVSIVTEGTLATDTIETRFLIWGIWKGVFHMMGRNRFQNALFTLHWNGIEVGHIIFARSALPSVPIGTNLTYGVSQQSRVLSNSNLVTVDTLIVTNVDTLKSPDGHEFRVSLVLDGQSLTVFELFITVLSGMAYIAEFSNTQELESFSISPATFDTTLAFQPETERLLKSAPLIEAQWVTAALGLIPTYAVERSDFREVSFKVQIDGESVGYGTIRQGRT